MFAAGNIMQWLPSLMKKYDLPAWANESMAPVFIIYGLASGLNYLMLKNFIFMGEITTDYNKIKKEKSNLSRKLTANTKKLDQKSQECDTYRKKWLSLQDDCKRHIDEKEKLTCEIADLELTLQALNGTMLSQMKKYSELKRKSEGSDKQYNTHETASGNNSQNLQEYAHMIKQ